MRIELISDASVFVPQPDAVQLKSGFFAPPKTVPGEGEAATGLACVIDIYCEGESAKRSDRIKVCASTGVLSSSEAELAAGLLGMAFLAVYFGKGVELSPQKDLELTWRCDNQGVINSVRAKLEKGVTTAAKSDVGVHRHFFQILASFESSLNLTFTASQLASTLKESRQLSCDRVSRWLRIDSEKLSAKFPSGLLGRIGEQQPELAWQRIEFPVFASLKSDFQITDWEISCAAVIERFSEMTKNS